jgi:hypothetical protein
MLTVYRALIRLYPRRYRQEFGDEMLDVLREAREAIEGRVSRERWIWSVRESAGLLCGVVREHARNLGAIDPGPVLVYRRFEMRSEFRFPKATAALMTIILAGVVLAIEEAKAIVNSVPHVSPHVGPIQPAHFTVWPALLLVPAGACLMAAIGWSVLYVFHRSGVQRFAQFDPSTRS